MSRIAIVEDDPMIAEIYMKKFTSEGFDVIRAETGDELLKAAQEDKIDLVLLDLVMPKMDGFEVIKELRTGAYDPDIRIIVFSNLSQREDKERAMDLGANGFITKSDYTPSQLVEEVRRLLNQYQEQKRNEARLENPQNGTADVDTDRKRILIIEDEEVFIEMFSEKLKQEGFDVVAARNGAWGIKEAQAGNYDLYILDVSMPVMDGEEILVKLRQDEKTKNVPAIMMSASSQAEKLGDLKDLGVVEFIMKTQITPSALANKVKETLGMQ